METLQNQSPDEPCKSMQDLLNEATSLAGRLCYDEDGTPRDTSHYGEEASSLLWSYVDFLQYEYHSKRITGRCSLAEMISYDIGAEEEKICNHVELFTRFLGEQVSRAAA